MATSIHQILNGPPCREEGAAEIVAKHIVTKIDL